MQTKLIVGVMVLLGILGAGYYFANGKLGATEEDFNTDEEMIDDTPVVLPPVTYASSSMGFYLKHPSEFSVNEGYAYEAFGPKKPIAGVKFMIPATMATGTNLSEDSGLSVEVLPRAKKCTGDIYVKDNVPAVAYEENGMKYSLATTTGAAAGNRYEEMVYAITDSNPCIAVRYFIHTTNVENYEPGTVVEYDRPALIAALDAIRNSLRLGSPEEETAGAASTTPSGETSEE